LLPSDNSLEYEETDSIIITQEEAGERLDKILTQRFDAVKSRTYFQMLIDEQKVLLNNRPVKKRIKPQVGDEVQIHFILTPEIGLSPEPIPLDIIYEDDDIIVINKAAGMVVHPGTGNWSGTFVNALLHHCKHLCEDLSPSNLRPGIVHRLDKDTSGLLMAAKTSLAQQRLIAMFSNRQIHKEYLTVCIGNPGDIEINAPIGRDPVNRKLMTVRPEGRPSLSYCKVVAYNSKFSLVRVVLATGRTHQIRVHLKHVGTPVLGDESYGNTQINAKQGVKRQMLHAQRLRFNHPITGKLLELEAPIPSDMAKWMRNACF
jgi:23S rRNA pseudouridine1911/1915/1917 synthase